MGFVYQAPCGNWCYYLFLSGIVFICTLTLTSLFLVVVALNFAVFSASRLGLDACLVTKVGSDANGRLILEGLREEGVDVSRVIVSDSTPSAFTYIIVDKEGGTRTCIHTPQTEGIHRASPRKLDSDGF